MAECDDEFAGSLSSSADASYNLVLSVVEHSLPFSQPAVVGLPDHPRCDDTEPSSEETSVCADDAEYLIDDNSGTSQINLSVT